MTTNTLELLTVTEAARRIGACSITLKRRIARAGLVPDAVIVEGTNRLRSPLFVEPRLGELERLLHTTPASRA
jgi:hypothetical protein